MILLLLCSFISCLPFNWISHWHVWLQPGSDPAYPSHNDQFSPHPATANSKEPPFLAATCICLYCDGFKHHNIFSFFNLLILTSQHLLIMYMLRTFRTYNN